MKKYIVNLILFCSLYVRSQDVLYSPFVTPFNFPLYLSGNFGELRSSHFHGGIDFKTEGVEGKTVHCIADGYISRIIVSPRGYGKALYVTHFNGYVSVYGHLRSFLPAIEKLVEEYQYKNETFPVDMHFDSFQFPVNKGKPIAWSGDTGYSFGPHLHLEIRKIDTGEHVDPLQFYKNKIKDTIPPQASAIMIYPQTGTVNGFSSNRHFEISLQNSTHCLSKTIKAWGDIGVGIKAFDYMNGTKNRYGVYSVTLYVDSVKIFNSTMDGYLPDENRMINSWTDFKEYKQNNNWFMRSFIVPGNKLRFLWADKNRGLVTINEERDYNFLYELKDIYGNASYYHFEIKGKKQLIEPEKRQGKYSLVWNQLNVIQEPGIELVIPRGMLYENISLNFCISTDSSAIAYGYRLHDEPVPFHNDCNLFIGVRNKIIKDTTKYYVAHKIGKRKYSVGGKYNRGWMEASIRELSGVYTIEIDTILPEVKAVNKITWGAKGKIIYKIEDRQTGIKSYKGKIDGKFALFTFSAKNALLTCILNSRYIKKGNKHVLELEVTDHCDNTKLVKEEFIW